jgi:hypothetical protein
MGVVDDVGMAEMEIGGEPHGHGLDGRVRGVPAPELFSGSLPLLDLGKTRGPWRALGNPPSETAGSRNKFDQRDVARELATRAATPSAASG